MKTVAESPLRVVDLFCGAGGFSLGFRAAGCEILAAADVDETAARTFELNLTRLQRDSPPFVVGGEEANLEDLDLDRLASKGPPDILIGGPPCQGFSRIGRAKLDSLTEEGHVSDPRNELYLRFLDAAELWQPRAVVMENVPGMLSLGGRNVADEAAADLAARGYRVGYAILNAVWYGVPQHRERLFFIGIREDQEGMPQMPRATHSASLPSGYVKPSTELPIPLPFIQHFALPVRVKGGHQATTAWEALADLPDITAHLPEPERAVDETPRTYKSVPQSAYARLMRFWPELPSSEVNDHIIRKTPRDYEIFRRMNPGDRYPAALAIAKRRFQDELERLQASGEAPAPGTPAFAALQRRYVPPYPESQFVDKWRKLVPGQPSWTVPAHLSKDAYSHIHYDSFQARAVSIREAARLQSFPDAFAFSGNVGERFRQIGNAVPPLLSWVVASAVLTSLGTKSELPDWTALEAQKTVAVGS